MKGGRKVRQDRNEISEKKEQIPAAIE